MKTKKDNNRRDGVRSIDCSEFTFRLQGAGKRIDGKIKCEKPSDLPHAAVAIFSQLMADLDVVGDSGRIEFVIIPNVSDHQQPEEAR
jgi:hypothetical protein